MNRLDQQSPLLTIEALTAMSEARNHPTKQTVLGPERVWAAAFLAAQDRDALHDVLVDTLDASAPYAMTRSDLSRMACAVIDDLLGEVE